MSIPDVTVKDREHHDSSFLEVIEDSKDPNRHYRWVRLDGTNAAVTKARMKGYTEVLLGDVETIATPASKGEGFIIIGDLILMSCPKEEFERRLKRREDRAQTLINSTTIEAERVAAQKGIQLIKDKDHQKES